MGVSLGNDGEGRRKAVDADLNLVPYIDLLTCMVAFLLITAVWSQLARLSVAQKANDLQVLSEDGIVFDTLVRTMDAAMAAGFPDLSLLDTSPGR